MSSEKLSTVAFYDSLWARTRRLDQHHKCRMHAIERTLRNLPPPNGRPRRILELGCGSGLVSSLLVRYGDLVGLDQSSVGVETARVRVNGRFVVGSLPEISIPEGDFDVCVLSQVIEHFIPAEQVALLRGARAKIIPGGHLILTTPNRPISERMRFAKGELQPVENWLAPEDLRRLLEETGWRVREMRFAFNFFPILASRHPSLRAARFLLYDVLHLRSLLESVMEARPRGDCIVVLASRV